MEFCFYEGQLEHCLLPRGVELFTKDTLNIVIASCPEMSSSNSSEVNPQLLRRHNNNVQDTFLLQRLGVLRRHR